MRHFILGLFIAISFITFSEAKVQFIADSDNDAGASFVADPNLKNATQYTTGQKCSAQGYAITKCPKGYRLTTKCPQDSSYYKECCSEDYNFTKTECERAGQKSSVTTCGGLHRCI